MIRKAPTVHHQFASFFKGQKTLQPYAYATSKSLAEGSICIDVTTDPKKLFEGYREEENMEGFAPELPNGGSSLIGTEQDVKKPFVLHKNNFYITRYFNYETQIIEGIKSLIEKGAGEKVSRVEWLRRSKEFSKLVENRDRKLDNDWQLIASAVAFLNNFSIITGGPGTGKTTTVAKILSLLYEENEDLDVKLAAPTGKAAMRMKEALANNKQVPADFREKISDLKPYTLHRLLGVKHQSPYFKHDSENRLKADVIIVDEASMIDVALFARFINAIGPLTRLILLGDQNQLASVEAGSLLGDLCNSVEEKNLFSPGLNGDLKELVTSLNLQPNAGKEKLLQDHIVELQHSYRFDENPEFRKWSEAVINNKQEEIESFFKEDRPEGNIHVDAEYSEKEFEKFIKGFEEYIAEEDVAKAIEIFNGLRILAVIRQGRNGVEGLNARVENYLKNRKKITLNHVFYENRPVIVTKNHPDLNLFNGDVGLVRKDKISGKMRIWFLDEEKELEKKNGGGGDREKKLRNFSPGVLTNVETVYAMTVHKSQGSEFDRVFLVMPKSEELPLLTRELLYTGITRAKNRLTLQGTKEVIKKSAEARVKRASGITKRI